MSFYDIDQDEWDDDGYRLLKSKWVTALKEHTCVDCKLPILPGTRYYRVCYVFGGKFYSEAAHTAASLCIPELRTDDGDHGYGAPFPEDVGGGD